MTSPKKASADRQISVGDRTLMLRYSVKAMAALQDHWGLASFQEVGAKMSTLGDEISAGDMAAILWAGTRTHHPEIDQGVALDLVDDLGIEAFEEVMIEAFEAASPDPGEGGGEASANPPKRGRSTA